MTTIEAGIDLKRVPRARGPKPAGRLAVHVVLLAFVVLSLGPLFVVILNSLKTTQGIFSGPFEFPTAETFSLEGFQRALTKGHFIANYRNSLVVTVSTVLITCVAGTLAAYALTEFKVKLSGALSALFVVGIMLPIRLGTVPILRLMISTGLVDTLVALILVYSAMSIPLAVALMMTYFRSVPAELKEAARIDGAGEVRTLGTILPIVRPGIAAVASVTMLPVWNDLWFPLILAPSKANQTVTLGVQQFIGQFLNDYPAMLAALTMGAVPLIVLFVVFSRQFIKGLSEGYGK
jgi:raffinose/stachyose/melibiose transport system permease protein